MGNEQDRVDTFSGNVAANDLFTKEGGLAVWVRREEVVARACVRGSGDIVDTVMLCAAALAGLNRLMRDMAQHHDVPAEDFDGMVRIAHDELDSRTDHVTRIKRKP